jgi:hypothetical protein
MRYVFWIGLVITVALVIAWAAFDAFDAYGPPPSPDRSYPCALVLGIGHAQTLDVCAMDGEAMDVRADEMRMRSMMSYGKRVPAREFTVEILGRARSPFVPVGARTRVFTFEPACSDSPDITLQQGHRYLLMGRWDDDLGGYRLEWGVESVFEVHDGRLSPLEYSLMDLNVEGHTPAAFLARVRAQCRDYERHPLRRKYQLPKVVLH